MGIHPFLCGRQRVALRQARPTYRLLSEGAGHHEALPYPPLLLRQPFDEEAIRTDFIDFCLMRLADPKSTYVIRAQCIKLAYEQMRHWPELFDELRQTLEMISCEPLSPGLRSAWICL